MKYLAVDGNLGGTGIRDIYEGGFLALKELNLSNPLMEIIRNWVDKYEEAHYHGFIDQDVVNKLDKEGIEIARMIKNELKDVKLEYYSAATGKKNIFC